MEASPAPPQVSSADSPSTARLEILDPSKPHTFLRPTKSIHEGPDVSRFLTSKGYRDIGLFVLQLNHALCPRFKAPGLGKAEPVPLGRAAKGAIEAFPLGAKLVIPDAVVKLQQLLEKAAAIIDEAPPDTGPRRFGNISFRKWHALLQERAGDLLQEYLPADVLTFGRDDREAEKEHETAVGSEVEGPFEELKEYFIGGFGSAQRLDYGTGHELSFLAFLGCLWKLGAFAQAGESEDVERSIVLGVVEPYLKVIRRLILTYTLEPAGTHGVWGLDDHFFLSYIFGSAQFARPIHANEPTPLEGSLPGAPKPSSIVKAESVEEYRTTNMYFSAIGFINDVKKGPFWEHSPILFDISGIKDGWGKINKGMIKMFNAEVLSKFPVVQHFPFGSLFSWDSDPDAAKPVQTIHMVNQPIASAATAAAMTSMPSRTVAPGAGRMNAPGAEVGTAAPWARGGVRMPPPGAFPGRIPPGQTQARTEAAFHPPPAPRGGVPDTGPPPPSSFVRGMPGTASNQHTVTKAPWAKD